MAEPKISNHRKIQKVMPLILQLEEKSDYYPETVSFGPYHHGQPNLAFVEAFKPKAVDLFISGGRENMEFYHNKVADIIGEVRNCYVQTSMGDFSNADLAQMMLRDASLIIIFMEVSGSTEPNESVIEKLLVMSEDLGMLTFEILSRDLHLLENQIPLFVIKFLIDLRYGAGKGDEIVNRYINTSSFGEYIKDQKVVQKEDEQEPLHLLEAIHRLLVPSWDVGKDTTGAERDTDITVDPEIGVVPAKTNCNHDLIKKILACKSVGAIKPKQNLKNLIPTYRSATDLKAKGIYFKPSPSKFLNDANFKYYILYARLRLPQYGISTRTKVFFKNMVAYELSPNSPACGEILSYINLMKSLIDRPEDVKELREKTILINLLGSDEEVLQVFKDINTYGADNSAIFKQVNDQIRAHCNSKMKTWMAELIHTNFRTPWTVFAFLVAIAVLGISAVQTYYAVHPASSGN